MSATAVVPAVTTAAPTEVSINNTPAEILASHAAEKEAQAASPATIPAAPTTPAPVVETKPYEIIKGQDGSVEVKFNEGGQVFKGTMDEVLEKISESKLHANQRIKELSTPTIPAVETPAAPTTPQMWQPDEATSVSALNGMLTGGNFGDAVKIGLAQAFGVNDPNQVLTAISELYQLHAELKGQKEISKFAQQAPDFPWAESNTQMLIKEAQARNLPLTAENLVFTHQALKGMGKYQAATSNVATPQTPNPAPPNASGNVQVATDIDPWEVPLDELAANIRSGR